MANPYLEPEAEEQPAPPQPSADRGPSPMNPYLYQAEGNANPYMDAPQPQPSQMENAALSPSAGPGYFDVAVDSAMRGGARGMEKVSNFYEGIKRKLSGETFFHVPEQPEATAANPEVEGLLNTPMQQGWTSPKWWAAQAVNAISESWPEMVAAGLGGRVGGMPGMVTGMSAGSGLLSLIPAFKEAKAKGLSDDDAVTEAAKVAAVNGGTAMLAGVAGMQGFTGALMHGKTVEALKVPIKEALVQLGLVQPTIAVAGSIARGIAQGKELQDISPWDVAHEASLGVLTQAPFTGYQILALSRPRRAPSPPAGVEHLQGATEGVPAREIPVQDIPAGERMPAPEGWIAEQNTPQVQAPTFYSAIKKFVEEKGQNTATGEQWSGTIRNAPGIKLEEFEALGLPAFLGDEKGRISKADLLAHIEENQIQLLEKELTSGPPLKWTQTESGLLVADAPEGTRYVIGPRPDGTYTVANSRGGRVQARDIASAQTLAQQIEAQRRSGQGGETQYGAYTLPGPKEKYGELLFKLPDEVAKLEDQYNRLNEEFMAARADNPLSTRTQELAKQLQEVAGRYAQEREGKFKAPHFGEEGRNLLAHARYTSRLDRDGKNTLFVEEIQSDWHQRGRKQGYTDPEKVAQLDQVRERINQLRDSTDGILNSLDDLGFDSTSRARAALVREGLESWDIPPEYRPKLQEYVDTRREFLRLHDEVGTAVADAPFKSSWDELMFKRLLRYAADNGYERISWTNGDQQIARYPGLGEVQARGMVDFYGSSNKIGALDKIAQKWAKKLGMDGGETTFDVGPQAIRADEPMANTIAGQRQLLNATRNRYINVSPEAGSRIKRGLPLFEQKVAAQVIDPGVAMGEVPGIRAAARQAIKVLENVRKAMGLEGTDLRKIELYHDPNDTSRGWYHPDEKIIRINLANAQSPEQIYSTLAHEFGHHLMYDVFDKLPPEKKVAIFDDYDKFVMRMKTDPSAANALVRRRAPISEFNEPSSTSWRNLRWIDMPQAEREYWFGFNEWFADNVARWATTDAKPMSVVDKFFSSLGRVIRDVVRAVRQAVTGESFEAAPAMRAWLDSFIQQNGVFGPEVASTMHLQGLLKNARALQTEGTEAPATPQMGSTGGGRAILDGAGAGAEGRAFAAHGDRMNWFYKVALSLQQIAKRNEHILPLQLYRELTDLLNLETITALNQADINVMRPWKHLSREEGEALGRFIDDYANGRFMDPKELAKDGLRRPTDTELRALIKKHGLTERGAKQFGAIITDLRNDLMRYKDILMAETSRIRDPIEQAQAMERVEAQIRAMDSIPFMPFARFGDYTATTYTVDGKVKEFYRFETQKARDRAVEQMQAAAAQGEQVKSGFLHKDVHPLLGMPPGMLDRIADKLNLSQNMRDSIDQLKFEYAPAQSFRHHFQQKDFTPGYSQDWQRAYAQYKFHGSHYFARIKYADQMRDMIAEMTNERLTRNDHTKLDQIRNLMTEHLDTVLNPKADYARLKGAMFHFHMGFRVSTAAINLTQVPLVAWPNLSSHFGDFKSAAALIRATGKSNTLFRRMTTSHMAADELRILQQGADDGLTAPKQAYELGALSEGRNLFKGLGKGIERTWQEGAELSAKMFEMSEQWGRTTTLLGAYDLAKKDLGSKFVQNSIQANQLLYLRLREKNWSHEEAAAYTAATVAVKESMFEYGYHARPKMFQGGLGAVLLFKSFQQNVLFNLWNNKGSFVRQMLLLGGAAGLAGLPFSEDISSIMKMLSKRFLSSDFDLEDEVRKQVRALSNGAISPDLVMHGVGRYAFGVPHVLDLMGSTLGLRDKNEYAGTFPEPRGVSISRSIGMGQVLPFDVGRAFSPSKSPERNELQQIQRASGAAFGIGFSLYNFATSNPFTEPDRKKWEQIMPAAIRDVSTAWRFAEEGGERNRRGNQIIKFDPYDTMGAAEILARGLGFQPTRLVARQENIAAKAEAVEYWEIRRQLLMRQYWSAVKDNNPEQIESVIEAVKAFNRGLPEEAKAKAITGTNLRQSIVRRAQDRARQESGLPTGRRDTTLYQSIDALYPEGAPPGLQDIRRVQ